MESLVQIHRNCVSSGRYDVARKLLRFLNESVIRLGLSDTDWEVEEILDSCNYRHTVNHRGIITYYK